MQLGSVSIVNGFISALLEMAFYPLDRVSPTPLILSCDSEFSDKT